MDLLKNKKVLVYVVMGLLSLAAIYAEYYMCFTRTLSFKRVAEFITTLIMCVLTFYYAVSNFKVPHGNLLKYLFLAFSVIVFVGLINNDTASALARERDYINQLLRGFTVISSAYIAGRLDRKKENTILLIINSIILLGTSVMNIIVINKTDIISLLYLSSFFVLWIDLAIAYLFRYYGHKEAGLEDK